MTATLHLHSIQDAIPDHALAGAVDTVFFVIQRANGHWSVGAKIIDVFNNEAAAEAAASDHKRKQPQQNFGVAMLRSEARNVVNPVEIVRVVQ